DAPSFYRLNFTGRQYVTLILKGDETEVEVNADGNSPGGFSEVSGSYDTQYMRDMDGLMSAFQVDVQELNQRAIQARSNGDVETFQAVSLEYQDMARSYNTQLKNKIWESVPSLAAFYGIQRLDPEQYYSFFDSVSVALSKELPNNPVVMNLAQMVNTKRSLTIGAEAPEIALENPEGEVISLTSLRGKYVLVDFWAAWCRPCRAENPNIVRAYQKYQGQNFEILQVSLDRTRAAWLGAIEQDGLPWLHISDLKYWNSVVTKSYQINSIPASYLIDPEGKIIGKNLRGPMLEAKLKEIFG
ncbi:MAG: TlpA disulfide reductase family protein, partial [Cyclobacteriaceae bacterium]